MTEETKLGPDGVTRLERYDKFRSIGTVGWKTSSLFADVPTNSNREAAPFWLERNKLGDDRPCFRDWYLHLEDLSGNAVALKFLGCQEHWDQMVKMSPWFREAVEGWRKELQAIFRERAFRRALEIMGDSPASTSLSAAKFIHEIMKEEQPSKRGRPSKEELSGSLKKAKEAHTQTEEDWARITSIHGGGHA